MAVSLDHLVWATPDLDSGVAEIESRLGTSVTPGGRHPGVGTHNAVLDMGHQTYFEVLAPDPTQDRLWSFGRRVAGLDTPGFVGWACRTDDARATAQAAKDAGLYPGMVLSMSRQRPNGTVLSWRLFEIEGSPFGRLLPFFVEWRDGGHPCDHLPDVGVRLVELQVETPDPDGLRVLLDALDVPAPTIRQGDTSRLLAMLETPAGPIELG
ncbi:MAG: VOC family protein [Acidobacteriota bacterium]